MTLAFAVAIRALVAICLGLLPLSVGLPIFYGVALRTLRATPGRERVDVATLDALPCAIGVGAALVCSFLALGVGTFLAGSFLVGLLALAFSLRWRVRCTRTATEVARTVLGVPWRRRLYAGGARLEETGWGDISDPAAVEVRVAAEDVCELCWILRNQGDRAERAIEDANRLLAVL